MKLAGVVVGDYDGMSLPPRGAWIEMLFLAGCTPTKSWSLPPRGAWIEIGFVLTPSNQVVVAPPAGSVD